jgi:hypothetical protein
MSLVILVIAIGREGYAETRLGQFQSGRNTVGLRHRSLTLLASACATPSSIAMNSSHCASVLPAITLNTVHSLRRVPDTIVLEKLISIPPHLASVLAETRFAFEKQKPVPVIRYQSRQI